MNTETLQTKLRRLDEIILLPGNPKKHDVSDIKESFRTWGVLKTFGVNPETGHDIDGNGRLETLRMMYAAGEDAPKNVVVKREKVDGKLVNVWYVLTVDLPFDRETEDIVALRLNRGQDKGGYDEQKVFDVLEQAAAYGRLEQTGYDQGILEVLAVKYSANLEDSGSSNDGQTLPSHHQITEPEQSKQQQPVQPLSPSKTMTVQIFLDADLQKTFLERCSQLIKRNEIKRDDSAPVETLSELIFSLVRDAGNE